MQSVFKLPVAIALLRAAELGELQLRDVMVLLSADVRAGAATGLGTRIGATPVEISLSERLKTMIIDSDNTAVDALLSRIGGPRGVTQSLRALGVTGVRVDRGERELHCDNAGIAPSECRASLPWRCTMQSFRRLCLSPPRVAPIVHAALRYCASGAQPVTASAITPSRILPSTRERSRISKKKCSIATS